MDSDILCFNFKNKKRSKELKIKEAEEEENNKTLLTKAFTLKHLTKMN